MWKETAENSDELSICSEVSENIYILEMTTETQTQWKYAKTELRKSFKSRAKEIKRDGQTGEKQKS